MYIANEKRYEKAEFNKSGESGLYLPKISLGLWQNFGDNADYDLARDAHKNQRRRSGEPYIMHPVAVAEILYKLGMDNECIVGALLHDVVEDTKYDLDYIRQEFGDEVALLVDGVTKLGQIPLSTREEVQAENIRKMYERPSDAGGWSSLFFLTLTITRTIIVTM